MVKDSLLQFDRISPIVKKALLENGFSSLKDICGVSPSQLSQECGLPLQTALEIIRLARSLSIGDGPSDEEKNTLKNDGVSAYELLLKSRDSTRFILTMSEQVDKLLGGGIKLGQVTEICGMAGTGKSQFG